MKASVKYNVMDYIGNDIEMQMGYINEALNYYLEDSNAEAFLHALKPLIALHGSVSSFAKKTGINRTYFYKLFRNEVKPEFPTIVSILKGLGFEVSLNLAKAA
jgi:probable addiction module antidote protein